MREIDPLVAEYQHDKHRPRESEALTTLKKIASLVKPIMRQRGWRVGTLCEFYPQRDLLGLNVNRGEKICLRLRYPSDQRQFLPMDQVLDTMLHELCHIVHGPHNQEFHALWNQLRDEHMQLALKGYTGEGFLSDGKRLGGQRVPLHEARRLARAAAEKRRTLTAGSGQRLGGAPVLRGTDIRKVIADAAQRRIDVTKGCASGTSEGENIADEVNKNGFKTKAEEDDANERAIMEAYADLIAQEQRENNKHTYTSPSSASPTGQRSPVPPPVPERTRPNSGGDLPEPSSSQSLIEIPDDDSAVDGSWACPICTLINPETFLCCDACSSERPQPNKPAQTRKLPIKRTSTELNKPPTSGKSKSTPVQALVDLDKKSTKKPLGWVCHSCGTFMETEWWTCAGCGTMKLSS